MNPANVFHFHYFLKYLSQSCCRQPINAFATFLLIPAYLRQIWNTMYYLLHLLAIFCENELDNCKRLADMFQYFSKDAFLLNKKNGLILQIDLIKGIRLKWRCRGSFAKMKFVNARQILLRVKTFDGWKKCTWEFTHKSRSDSKVGMLLKTIRALKKLRKFNLLPC